MNKPQKKFCRGKEARTKEDILYNSIFMKYKDGQNESMEQIQWGEAKNEEILETF